MFRLRLTQSILVLGAMSAATGCARDLVLEEAADPAKVVIAQFDPTNAVPVLQLLPSPTALAQKQPTAEDPNTDALLDLNAVKPAPCEYPTTQQCLAFTKGWPTSAMPTYYFVGTADADGKVLDESSIQAGLKLYKAGPTGLSEVAYQAVVSPIPAPPAACQTAGNGSDPPRAYGPNEVPQGVQVVMNTTLLPATNYFVVLTSNASGGLRDAKGQPVEQSRLYSLLNVKSDQAPIQADGTITNALLRSNVQSSILAQRFGGRPYAELSTDEQAQFGTFYGASALRLVGLYTFFDRTATALEMAGVIQDRKDTILMNTWKTGPAPRAPTTIEFDPTLQKLPFPNSQLLTVADPSATDPNRLKVSLPISPSDSPTAAALKMGLNTLDGFATTAPMVITSTRDLDPTVDLTKHIVMYKVSPTGSPDATPVPLSITTTARTASVAFTIQIRGARPLDENTNYVVAVLAKVGDSVLTDVDGKPVEAETAFNFLKIPTPFITGDDVTTIPEAVLRPLQCKPVPTTGMIESDAVVKATANSLETQLMHSRWLEAFNQLMMLSPAIDRTNVVMAWNYKTQTITSPIGAVRSALLPLWESNAAGPRLIDTGIEYTGTASIAELAKVAQNLCVGICRQGAMLPAIPAADCTDPQGVVTQAVRQHPFCGLAVNLVAGQLQNAHLYLMRTFRATVGSPYVAGTFTPQTVMAPTPINIPIWVIRGAGAAPASGYPIAIMQHGLGSQKEAGFYIANMLARANATGGWATVVMDLPFHGSRASDLTRVVNGAEVPCVDGNMRPNIDPADVTCTTNPATLVTTCTGGCDGRQDSSGTGFLSTNVFSARDNFRQATIDQLVLLNTLQQESAPGKLLDFLDGSRVGYIGQSLGSITGANLLAYTSPTEMDAAVLNVGGGSLTTILINAVPQISAPLFAALNQAGVCEYNVAGDPTKGCKPTPAFKQFLLTAQWALDPGDPLGTSINTTKTGGFGVDNILMQMSKPDPVVTHLATYALAYSGYGIPPGNPRLQVYDFTGLPAASQGSGCHPFLLAPVCGPCLVKTLCNTLGAQYQAVQFLESDGVVPTSTTPAFPPPQFVGGFDCSADCN